MAKTSIRELGGTKYTITNRKTALLTMEESSERTFKSKPGTMPKKSFYWG